MTMTAVKSFRGAVCVNNYVTFEEECAKHRGIVAINNNDIMCLSRAPVVTAYLMKFPIETDQVKSRIILPSRNLRSVVAVLSKSIF